MNNSPTQKKKPNLKVSKKDLQREQYRRSYYEFFKAAFKVLRPGDDFVDNWHIKYICDLLQAECIRIVEKKKKDKDIIINVMPRESKSLICSIIFPVWCWTIQPSLEIITVSYNADISSTNSLKSKQLIESDWFQNLYGDLFKINTDQNSKSDYENNKTGKRKAVGVGGGVTGLGGDIIIVDDPQNPKMAGSEVLRKEIIDYYVDTLYNRLNNVRTGIRIIIQQRLHENDLTGYLLSTNPEEYRHICLPAELTDRLSPPELSKYYIGGVFDPTRFPESELQKFRKKPLTYSGQYLQSPAPAEGLIFKRDWFRTISYHEFTQLLEGKNYTTHFTVDPAYTADTSNDPTAIMAYVSINKNIYIRNVKTVWKEFYELKSFIREFCLANGYTNNSRIYIEGAASGKSLISELRKSDNDSVRLNAVEINTPRKDKESRAIGEQAKVESGMITLIDGPYVDSFIEEVTSFPKSKHDDMVDCMLYALDKGASSGTWDFRFS